MSATRTQKKRKAPSSDANLIADAQETSTLVAVDTRASPSAIVACTGEPKLVDKRRRSLVRKFFREMENGVIFIFNKFLLVLCLYYRCCLFYHYS